MLISELSFPHLQAEREARLTRELEQRRVVRERMASGGRVAPPKATGVEATHKLIQRLASTWAVFRRTPHRSPEAIGNTAECRRAA